MVLYNRGILKLRERGVTMNSNLAYQDYPSEELIGGKLVAMSPRPSINHNRVIGNIYRIFAHYLNGRKCEPFADGVDLYLTETDRFIPDMMVVCGPDKIKPDGVYGPPDLVVEVLSPSTARYDRGHKKDVYARCGVREYWIVSPGDRTVEQYLLEEGQLALHETYGLELEVILNKMSQEERDAIPTEFKCSRFDDLVIQIADIFERVV